MKNIYNIYLMFGTVPSLYAQMNIYIDDKPSVVFVRSSGYFNIKNKPSNLIFYDDCIGNDLVYLSKDYQKIVDSLNKIISKDKKAKFIVYIDDSRVQFLLKPFILADCYDKIEKIVMISEGNITEYMYSDIAENDFEFQEKRWNLLIKSIKDNNQESEKMLAEISNYCFYLSTINNNELLLPYSELLENKNVSKEYKEKMNLRNLDLQMMLDKVGKNISFGKEIESFKFDEKSIVIIGTYNFYDNSFSKVICENLIDQVLVDYPEYSFYYKAHPLYPVENNAELSSYLKSRKIKVIPEKMPLEILLYRNKNVSIGGFCSSIHSLISLNRIKFMFGEFIGFSKLLKKNNLLKVKVYNVEISQKIADASLKIYYNSQSKFGIVDYHSMQIENLNNKVYELTDKINFLEEKLNKIGIKNNLRRIKNKFIKRSK